MSVPIEIPPLPAFDTIKPQPITTPAIAALTDTIGSLYRVTVAHTSRLFLGTFVCIDPQGNLVLDQTLEFELGGDGEIKGDPQGRDVGLVMIKRKWWTRVERMLTDEERRAAYERQLAQESQRGCTPS
ncbi:hypothetical protein JCM10908_003091 [Rhodotorula pacifica]|uniref:uncharacterized protein n=1 Tax=Rhodotorula pacifica TaxID=1495444 RepID=UPI00316FBBF7